MTSIQSCQKLALAWVFPPVSGAENIVYFHLFQELKLHLTFAARCIIIFPPTQWPSKAPRNSNPESSNLSCPQISQRGREAGKTWHCLSLMGALVHFVTSPRATLSLLWSFTFLHTGYKWAPKPHLRVKIQWVLQIGVLPYVGKTKIFPFNSIEIKKEQNPWYLRQTLHFGIIVWGKLYWGCCGCCSMGGDANFTSLPFPGVREQREGWVLVRR